MVHLSNEKKKKNSGLWSTWRILFCLLFTEFSETPNLVYFYANFLFCTHTFPAGDSILHLFFLLMRLKLVKTAEEDSRSPNLASAKKIRRSPLIRCPRVCHKMSSRPIAVGVILFSSWSIRMLHSDCVFIDRSIITPMQI